MRRKFNLTTLLYATVLLFSACSTPKTITADLDGNNLKKSIDNFRTAHPKVNDNDIIIVNVYNLNKDLYTVKIVPNAMTYNTTVPSTLSVGSLPGAILKGVATGANIVPGSRASRGCSVRISTERGNINANLTKFQAAVANINQAVAYNNYLLLLEKECGQSAASVKVKADSALTFIPGSAISGLSAFIDANVKTALQSYLNIEESIIKVDDDFAHPACKNDTSNHQVDFTDSEKSEFSDLKTAFTAVQTFDQTRQKEIILQNYQAVTNPSNYLYTAIDTAHHADVIKFSVSIMAKNWVPCRAVDTSFALTFKVKRFKIDFSTGVFMNWGGPAFTGKSYFISSAYAIQQVVKNTNTFIPSVGALAHFYYRCGNTIEPGLVLGTSLSTDVKYTQFHGGISLMFNTDNEVLNRIALSGGFTYRYISQLNSGYPVGTVVDKNLTIDQVESGRFIKGYFIGLTYDLSKN